MKIDMKSPLGQLGLLAAGTAVTALGINAAAKFIDIGVGEQKKDISKPLISTVLLIGSGIMFSQKKGNEINEFNLLMLGISAAAINALIHTVQNGINGTPMLKWQDSQMLNGTHKPKATIIY
jgi:hypothetical protein